MDHRCVAVSSIPGPAHQAPRSSGNTRSIAQKTRLSIKCLVLPIFVSVSILNQHVAAVRLGDKNQFSVELTFRSRHGLTDNSSRTDKDEKQRNEKAPHSLTSETSVGSQNSL